MNTFFDSLVGHWFDWVAAATWQLVLLTAIVAVVAWCARKASPRLRYALWLLVLVKTFLPPSLAIDWSVGNWVVRPLWESIDPTAKELWQVSDEARVQTALGVKAEITVAVSDESKSTPAFNAREILFAIWVFGCSVFSLIVFWKYRKLLGSVAQMECVDEGPLKIREEGIALSLRLKQIPQLYLSDEVASPFLFGLLQPCIVLPRRIAENLDSSDLDSVLSHELNHWRRRDTWVGWLQVLSQCLFWFHPLVWWANARLRHERECACDEAVLRTGVCVPTDYGGALLEVLTAVGGRSTVRGSLVGVFEPGGDIQTRLEQIMNYEPGKHGFGLLSRGALLALGLMLLPMAAPAISANTGEEKPVTQGSSTVPRHLPWIASTNPPVGATDVEPGLAEISITFDRDMSGGMSWTGDKNSFFPPTPEAKQAYWKDSRTCVLPVKLTAAQYYRVGINSASYRNFKSQSGEAAPCSVFCFVTRGASKAIENRVRVPQIVKLDPENGAENVDSKTDKISVTFDMPMGKGMSWTGGGENFPKLAAGRSARWTNGGKTCVLSVQLKSDWHYMLGINSPSHINFQSKWGVPVEPVEYRFQTGD